MVEVVTSTVVVVGVVAVFVYYVRAYVQRARRLEGLLESEAELRQQLEMSRRRTRMVEADRVDSEPYAADPPDELVRACRNGTVMLFMGDGVSERAGLTPWDEFLERLNDVYVVDPDVNSRVQQALEQQEIELAGRLISSVVARADVARALREWADTESERAIEWRELLARLPVNGAVTTGWDTTAETTFSGRNPRVIVPSRTTDYRLALREHDDRFVIIKPYGSPDREGELVWSSKDLQQAVLEDPEFERYFRSVFGRWSFLFVGLEPSYIERFLTGFRLSATNVSHYALLPEAPLKTTLGGETLRSFYNIDPIVYQPGPDDREIDQFFERLIERVGDDWKRLGYDSSPNVERRVLNHVRIENFGPFELIDLPLEPGWTMLVGINGSGKTSLLRAIAIGLCGDDPQIAGLVEHMVGRHGDVATIEVSVGGTPYSTTVSRAGVTTHEFTPLREGKWAALAFPALRGISLGSPTRKSTEPEGPPSVQDVLPVLSYSPDHRLDDTKAWIYGLYAQSQSTSVDASTKARTERIIEDYFLLLNQVSPGMKIEFGGVDLRTQEVRVLTKDGQIGLDDLSQGITSVLGWLGVLIQRMHEIYPDAEDPTRMPALVLIDEIDAHMHPDWQKRFVGLVQERFPNLQVVATTHSPLVVGEMADEGDSGRRVLVFGRDETGSVTLTPPPYDWEGLTADQILTSPIFGLRDSQSSQVEEEIDRYADLLGRKASLDESDLEEFEQLEPRVRRFSVPGATATARRVEAAVSLAIERLSDPNFAPPGSPDETQEQVTMRLRRRLEEELGSVALEGHHEEEPDDSPAS